MRKCNICEKEKADIKFQHVHKKTCLKCEFRWKTSFLRLLVQDRGGLMSVPQVFIAKQWNLVAVNINVMIGYSLYLINS